MLPLLFLCLDTVAVVRGSRVLAWWNRGPLYDYQVHALNGSGRAPAGLDLKAARAVALKETGDPYTLPPFHALTVTVPGAPAGW